jgi:hypothetical protein
MKAMIVWRLCTVLLLAAMGAHRYANLRRPADVQRYQQRIRDSVEQVPSHVGPWVAQDVKTPSQALSVLQPNVMISRQYVNIESGLSAGLLLVHCADAHSMVGHFPLRCYPADGWQVISSTPRDWDVNGVLFTGTEYAFSKQELGQEPRKIVVANCLMRPDGKLLRDMKSMTRSLIGAGGEMSGAGQIQIYFDAGIPQAKRDATIEVLVNAYRPVIDAILADPAKQ